MGLKSGSRDAGLDESKEQNEIEDESAGEQPSMVPEAEHEPEQTYDPETSSASSTEVESNDERSTVNSLPYKLRRDKVNEGREQVSILSPLGGD